MWCQLQQRDILLSWNTSDSLSRRFDSVAVVLGDMVLIQATIFGNELLVLSGSSMIHTREISNKFKITDTEDIFQAVVGLVQLNARDVVWKNFLIVQMG